MRLLTLRRLSFRVGLILTAIFTLVSFLPSSFGGRSGATHSKASGGQRPADSSLKAPDIENYDIRLDQGEEARSTLRQIRSAAGRGDNGAAATRQEMLDGERSLRRQVPGLRVEYNDDLRVPEMIGVDVNQPTFLTAPSGIGPNQKHAGMVRDFLAANTSLFGLRGAQVDDLVVRADYTNPNGVLSYVDLGQEINGIPIFRGEVRAVITADGAIARLINNLAPGLDGSSLPTAPGRAEDAVFAAARSLGRVPTNDDVRPRSIEDKGRVVTFYAGQFADPTQAELMYFPTELGVATLAWRVWLGGQVASYYVVVDAATGKLLWRKNTTSDQTQTATYNIYNDDSPGPLSPTIAFPGSGIQGPGISRSTLTLIGNEAPNPGQNNLGWMTDGTNITDGNNVEAGPDLMAPNGVDAPIMGSPNRVFIFDYNPPPLGSDQPSTTSYRSGDSTNMFYWVNVFHDRLYSAGFTEAARNFQEDNFGRGGIGGDRISAEAQDLTTNFSAGADGLRPHLQVQTFTQITPARDGALEGAVFLHELTHGLSSRLIGNGTGLGGIRAGGMSEGWSDFYALMMVSTANDSVGGIYPLSPYVSINFSVLGTDNYYYGIRRFPYAVKTTVGGPMNRPHNPLTFADIDPAQVNVGDGAYPAANGPYISTTATQVHNEGEVWCAMLFEVRARLIARLGFAAGTQRMLQLVTDGMKLLPLNPNFLQGRDAILAADQAGFGGADVDDIWAGFAARGAGFHATDDGTTVTESFSVPNVEITDPFSVSDAPGDNDGYPEPGENAILNVTISNNTGKTFPNVVGSVAGGGSANYGTLPPGSSITKPIPFTVPQLACGSTYAATISVTSTLIPTPATALRSFRVGAPVGGAPVTFSNTTQLGLVNSGPNPPYISSPYGTSINVNGLSGNKAVRIGFKGLTHTYPGDLDLLLVGPGGQRMTIMSDVVGTNDADNIDFSLSDSAASLLPANASLVNGAEYRPSDIAPADTFTAPAPGGPYQSPAPFGTATLTSVFGNAAANLNGTWTLYVVDDASSDSGVIAGGWYLTFEPFDFACVVQSRARADFDGDGISDVSVLRNGSIWYLLQSRDGFAGIQFGAQGDKAAPGDYDGDGRTDEAVFRSGTTWYLLRSTTGFTGISFGAQGDLPVAADYDGDHKTDVAVYRPSTGVWYVLRSSDGAVATYFWGQQNDKPIRGDFDGDGQADPTVFRDGNWFTLKSTGGTSSVHWGQQGDKPVPADYDGDHLTDLAVYRVGVWYILNSGNGSVTAQSWGIDSDVAVPADYDGDGREDIAVFRAGVWYILGSAAARTAQPEVVKVIQFGAAGDDPAPAGYVPEQ